MSAALDTAGRLRRLLAILTWLAQEGEAPIDEVASRFDLTPSALVAELEMAACCGVPPYTPDQLLEIVVTEDTVSTRVGTTLARPRRLSPREGLGLAAAARALLAVPGSDEDGALSRRWPSWSEPSASRPSTWSSTRRTCSTPSGPLWHPVSDWPSPTTRRRPTRPVSARLRRGACSRPKVTGISTPGAMWPTVSVGSGWTGSAPPRRPGTPNPARWPHPCRTTGRPTGAEGLIRGVRPGPGQPPGANRQRSVDGVAVRDGSVGIGG